MATGLCLRAVALALALCVIVLSSTGCAGMGETRAEGRRNFRRTVRLNTAELRSDINMALMLDEPSRLTDRRLPW